MERDIGTHAAGVAVTDFNSHAHVERDDSFADGINVPCNFNSHAHVERDALDCSRADVSVISTHTLTWSVTGQLWSQAGFSAISTHTLTWSVTHHKFYTLFP